MSLNYKAIIKIISVIVIICGATMIIPIITAFLYSEWRQFKTFTFLAVFMILGSYTLIRSMPSFNGHIRMRDGYVIVSIGWLTASLFGSFPYLISGMTDSFVDAFFESVASFTTTGATLFNLDFMPRSLLIWRSVCNWLGGMGILVLAISLLPALGIDGKTLAHAEVPGSALDKVSNRISDSAKNLYLFYFGFTVIEFLLLILGPMDVFDAMINTLSSVSTSGIPSMSHSFLHYDSVYTETIVSIFTILSSINFTLYYFIIHRNWKVVLSSIELRAFLLIILIASVLVVTNLYFTSTYSLSGSLRYGILQVISMATTSGVAIIGHANWPAFSLVILTTLMLIGGCSFSTCGAIKVIRVLVLFKLVVRGFYKRIHPRSVVAVKVGGKAISAQRVSFITVFVMLYILLIFIGAILLSLQNLDFITTLSSSVAMLANIGIGLGDVANGDFSVYCRPLRLVLCFLMMAGRLELFTFVTIFMPSFWNPNKYRKY